MLLKEYGLEAVNRVYLTQDMDQWRAVVNTVMSSWVI